MVTVQVALGATGDQGFVAAVAGDGRSYRDGNFTAAAGILETQLNATKGRVAFRIGSLRSHGLVRGLYAPTGLCAD